VLTVVWGFIYAPSAGAREGAFAGAGGPALIGALMDLSELERNFQDLIDIKGDLVFEDQHVFLMGGGGGFGGDDIRLGGFGGGGDWSFTSQEKAEFDHVSLDLGWGGFLMDQLLFEDQWGGLSVGLVLGGGEWTLRVSKDVQGDFKDLIIKPPLYLELHRSFWLALPYVSMEFRILGFMGLRVGAGYWLSLSTGEWKLPDERVVPGGPLKTMVFPVFQLMVIFGG
jgi:hypothetical protein